MCAPLTDFSAPVPTVPLLVISAAFRTYHEGRVNGRVGANRGRRAVVRSGEVFDPLDLDVSQGNARIRENACEVVHMRAVSLQHDGLSLEVRRRPYA